MTAINSPTGWPYLPPSLRETPHVIFNQFHGAVKTRIIQRQKQFWSRFIGAGFIKEDIETVWPETNLDFFGIRHSGLMRSYRLSDLNLRELDELDKWLTENLTEINLSK